MDPLPLYKLMVPAAAVGGLAVYCAVRADRRARIMLLGVLTLAGYGVVQDQVTARLCPEYFTALHNPIPGVTDPTLLGLLWGFTASVPGGLILGYAAGLAATLGPHPVWGPRRLVRPMLALAAGVGFVAAVAGYSAARHYDTFELRPADGALVGVPPERQRAAVAVACAHWATYVSAVVGSVLVCVWVGVRRGRSLDAPGGRV